MNNKNMSELKSSYKILSNENLVIEFHRGILTVKNYIAFKKKLMQNAELRPNMNYLINFKNVVFEASPSDIKYFADFMASKAEVLGKRKIALITNTPNQVVSTTIYKSLKTQLKQQSEIFSTTRSAINWLNISLSTEKIRTIFTNMN